MFSWIIESRGIQTWSFCNRVLCASGIQRDVEANRLVGASSGCRDSFKAILPTSSDIFLLWIWSSIHSLEIVFCDCSMLCRGCPWTWNGCIEN